MEEKFTAVSGRRTRSVKSVLRRIWRFVRWPFWIILALYVGLVIYRIPHAAEVDKTNKTIEFIRSHPITIADVDGSRLPPPPDKTAADATVEGIDANANGIRDDVELAIFALHPDSARIRAAELQYAKALQWQLTSVFNSDTLVATAQETGRGISCVGKTLPEVQLSDSQETQNKVLGLLDIRTKEVEDLVLNTDFRKQAREDAYKYMTSHGDRAGSVCDVDLTALSN